MVPGSRRVPLDTIARDTVNVPMDAEIVTYCGGPQCSQSMQAAQKLIELGYTNVRASPTVFPAGRRRAIQPRTSRSRCRPPDEGSGGRFAAADRLTMVA